MALMKTNLDVLEYENKIALLEKDKELDIKQLQMRSLQQRNTLLITAVITLVLLGFSYVQNRRRHYACLDAELQTKAINAKNQLLADVSHELRTPLTVLKLQVESLQHNLDTDVESSYNSLQAMLSDMNRLISDIYQLSQADIGTLNLNFIDLEFAQELDGWAEEFKLLITSNGLDWQFNNTVPASIEVNVDIDRLKQVLSNLLSNSVKYTDCPGLVSLASFVKNDSLYIVIEDSSPGVEKSEQTLIFDRLYRVEQSRSRATGGSGLGLAICNSLIAGHNGDISAETSELGGLKIVIRLPLVRTND